VAVGACVAYGEITSLAAENRQLRERLTEASDAEQRVHGSLQSALNANAQQAALATANKVALKPADNPARAEPPPPSEPAQPNPAALAAAENAAKVIDDALSSANGAKSKPMSFAIS